MFVAFTRLRWFVGVFALYVFVSLLKLLGFAALIVPGIYLSVAFSFVYIAMIDRNLGVWEAVKFSCARIHPHWWRMLLLHVMCFGIMIVGLLFLVVGTFVAYPITYAAVVYAYVAICGEWFVSHPQRPADARRRAENWIDSLREVSRGTRSVYQHLDMDEAAKLEYDIDIGGVVGEHPHTSTKRRENKPLLIALAVLILAGVVLGNVSSISRFYSVKPRMESPEEWMGEINSAYPDFRLMATREVQDYFIAIFADTQKNRLAICYYNTATGKGGRLFHSIKDGNGNSLLPKMDGSVNHVSLMYTERSDLGRRMMTADHLVGMMRPLPENFEGEIFIRFSNIQKTIDETLEIMWPPKEFLPTPQKSALARLTPWRAKASPWR